MRHNKSLTINKLRTIPYESLCYMSVLLLLVFLFSFLVFQVEAPDPNFPDILNHVKFTQNAKEEGWFSYTILQPLLYVFSFGNLEIQHLIQAAIYLLSIMVTIKSLVTLFILRNEGLSYFRSFTISLALIFVSPIINWWNWTNVYMGQLSPSIWHNPTTILNFPFAILLYYFSIRAIKRFEFKNFIPVSILIILCALTKPNYLLAFIPIFFIFLCYEFLFRKDLSKSIREKTAILALTFVPVLLLLVFEYVNVFNASKGSGIAIAPLQVWKLYSPNIPMSLLLSIAFPLSVTLFYFNQIRNNLNITFSWLVFITALLQFILFAETGFRAIHGNFMWGAHISLYILFLACMGFFIKQPVNKKWLFVWLIFILHLISGLFYYYKILIGFGYL